MVDGMLIGITAGCIWGFFIGFLGVIIGLGLLVLKNNQKVEDIFGLIFEKLGLL